MAETKILDFHIGAKVGEQLPQQRRNCVIRLGGEHSQRRLLSPGTTFPIPFRQQPTQ